jgi:hypothetical protein
LFCWCLGFPGISFSCFVELSNIIVESPYWCWSLSETQFVV